MKHKSLKQLNAELIDYVLNTYREDEKILEYKKALIELEERKQELEKAKAEKLAKREEELREIKALESVEINNELIVADIQSEYGIDFSIENTLEKQIAKDETLNTNQNIPNFDTSATKIEQKEEFGITNQENAFVQKISTQTLEICDRLIVAQQTTNQILQYPNDEKLEVAKKEICDELLGRRNLELAKRAEDFIR